MGRRTPGTRHSGPGLGWKSSPGRPSCECGRTPVPTSVPTCPGAHLAACSEVAADYDPLPHPALRGSPGGAPRDQPRPGSPGTCALGSRSSGRVGGWWWRLKSGAGGWRLKSGGQAGGCAERERGRGGVWRLQAAGEGSGAERLAWRRPNPCAPGFGGLLIAPLESLYFLHVVTCCPGASRSKTGVGRWRRGGVVGGGHSPQASPVGEFCPPPPPARSLPRWELSRLPPLPKFPSFLLIPADLE